LFDTYLHFQESGPRTPIPFVFDIFNSLKVLSAHTFVLSDITKGCPERRPQFVQTFCGQEEGVL